MPTEFTTILQCLPPSCVQAKAAEREEGHISVRNAAFQRIKQEQQHAQELGAHKERLQGNIQELGAHNERLQGDVQELGVHNERLQGNVQELGVQNERLQGNLQELGAQNEGLQGDVQELGGHNKRLQGDVQDLRTTLAQSQVCTVSSASVYSWCCRLLYVEASGPG